MGGLFTRPSFRGQIRRRGNRTVLDSHYAQKLIREVLQQPELLTQREKFWRPELFAYYLDPIGGIR